MDIYLTLLETGDRFQFPMLPEKVSIRVANEFANYQVMSCGEVQVPSGTSLDVISWSGMFPGWSRNNHPYTKEWKPILECIKWIENLKSKAGTTKKCRLLITESNINIDVYLQSFNGSYEGGLGDFHYDISLIQGRDLYVSSSPVDLSESFLNLNEVEVVERPETASSDTYTVVKGDCLWAIAQRFLGSGARYGEIYTANQSTIDSATGIYGASKYTIYPGQVFTIPS